MTFVTGHQARDVDGGSQKIDWGGIAGTGKTAVVYMGVKQAEALRSGLLDANIRADLPVALVENGSRESQRVIRGTVATIPALARQASSGSPSLLIIGQVAALAENLGWFESLQSIRAAA